MTLQLLINAVDYTAKWRVYESRWTSRAWNGESAQSEFVLDDFDGTIDHDNLAARKIVEVWEDASGTPVCMYRGRVANKGLGMGASYVQPAMQWRVQTEDYNIDLRGIRIPHMQRPGETDDERVLDLHTRFLNGGASTDANARNSTNLDTNFIGVTPGDAIGLPIELYEDSFPGDVLQRINEQTGRIFFVYTTDAGAGELYYANRGDDSLLSDIEVTDDDATADGVDVFAAYKGPQAGDHAGQDVMTGGAVRLGDGSYYEDSDIGGSEAIYDKWEQTLTNQWLHNESVAQSLLNKTVSNADETNTYLYTIDMRPEDAHRLKAGMFVPLVRKRANRPSGSLSRAVVVTHEPMKPNPDGESWYRVSVESGRPLQFGGVLPKARFRLPKSPTQPTEGGCTRLYFSETGSGFTVAQHAGWADGTTTNSNLLTTTPNGSTNTNITWSATGAAAGDYVGNMEAWAYQITDADLLADIQAGGLSFEAHIRSRSRSGVGISESSQDNRAQRVVRIYRPSTTTFLGTALALDSTPTGPIFPAQTTHVNRSFIGTLSAVGSAALNDWIVVEIGTAHATPTSGGTGAAWKLVSDAASDLPEDHVETADLNSWIDLCSSGSSGSEPQEVGGQGEGQVGDSGQYADADHVHGHGSLAEDGVHLHDLDQIQTQKSLAQVNRVDTAPTVNDDTDDGWAEGDLWVDRSTGEVWTLVDNAAGAAVWEQFVPSGAGGDLDDLADVVISSPADGEVLTYDSGSGDWVNEASSGGISATIFDAKGDVIAATAADTASRLAVGTNGHVLTADNAEATGLKWAVPSASTGIVPWSITPDGGAINLTNRTLGAANRAFAVPCTIPADCTLTGIRIVVGTQSGNVSVALYDSGLGRVATSGAVACPANGLQSIAFTGNYSATAGRYYLAVSADNNTATFGWNQQVSSGVSGPTSGIFMSTAHPCPTTFTSAGAGGPPALVGLISGGSP